MEERRDEIRFQTEKDIEEFVVRYVSRAFTAAQLAGAANGSNVRFSLSDEASFLLVYVDGLLKVEGTDYQRISAKDISFFKPPSIGATVVGVYIRV